MFILQSNTGQMLVDIRSMVSNFFCHNTSTPQIGCNTYEQIVFLHFCPFSFGIIRWCNILHILKCDFTILYIFYRYKILSAIRKILRPSA